MFYIAIASKISFHEPYNARIMMTIGNNSVIHQKICVRISFPFVGIKLKSMLVPIATTSDAGPIHRKVTPGSPVITSQKAMIYAVVKP